jgi:predicted PolB exonuclease-like 3'-5' exonuclease
MLNLFWDYAAKAERVITFNGRQFDVPFLILRSAMKGIKPTRKLLGGKYSTKTHIDLLEEFTFHGLVRKFNLDFYCRAFGIDSPKGHGITGMDVRELYKAGRIKDIAIYCGDDVRATFELFKIWDNYLNIN